MEFKHEISGETIPFKGVMVSSTFKYHFISLNKIYDANPSDSKFSCTSYSIYKSKFNDNFSVKQYDKKENDEIDIDSGYRIVYEKSVSNYYFALLETDDIECILCFRYNVLTDDYETFTINTLGTFKTCYFRTVEDRILLNVVTYDEEQTKGKINIAVDIDALSDDLVFPNIIESDIDCSVYADYNFQLNSLNSVMMQKGNKVAGLMFRELSAIVSNVILESNTFINEIEIDIKDVDEGITYEYINYDELKLDEYTNNVYGYAIDYFNVQIEDDVYLDLYKVNMPLFCEVYSKDNLEYIKSIQDNGLYKYMSTTDPEIKDYYFKIEGNFYYPINFKHSNILNNNVEIFYCNDFSFIYSYTDKNFVDTYFFTDMSFDYNVNIIDNYVIFLSSRFNEDASTDFLNIVYKFILVMNEYINDDVMFINILNMFPPNFRASESFKKIIDIIETVYNGGMKDLTSDHNNILFNNMGKYYNDDKKLYMLYRNSLDLWFYDKRNMIFGDNIFKFIESLDKYKKMDTIPFEDIFVFAKSFGLDVYINPSIFKKLAKSNDITNPKNEINFIQEVETVNEEYVRRSMDILRTVIKYRGSANFYKIILALMGFSLNIELVNLNTKNRVNSINEFDSLTNNITLEISKNITYNNSEYTKPLLDEIINLINLSLSIHKNFIGITYTHDINIKLKTLTYSHFDDSYSFYTIDKIKNFGGDSDVDDQ